MRPLIIISAVSFLASIGLLCNKETGVTPHAVAIVPTVNLVHEKRTVTRRSPGFVVRAYLDSVTTVRVTVPYIVSGSATAPLHHNLASGNLVFEPGDSIASVNCSVVDKSEADDFRTVVVSLGTPQNARIGSSAVDSITIAYNQIVVYQFLDNALPGWTQSPFDTDLNVVSGDGLYNVINGGATPYINWNYQYALWQVMKYSAGQTFTLMAMRFATPSDADSLFVEKTVPVSADEDPVYVESLEGYPQTQVLGTKTISGITYLMRFGQMYFELTMSGYASTALAIPVAKGITDYLVSLMS